MSPAAGKADDQEQMRRIEHGLRMVTVPFPHFAGLVRTVDRYPDRMTLCTSVAETRAAVAAGRHAALMGIEGGHAIEGARRERSIARLTGR